MIDDALLEKKAAFIETCVRELSEMARLDRFEADVREQRFILHTLQLAIQAAMDIASHIVSARRLGEPESNRQLFTLLARDGWIDEAQVVVLQAMAGLRNVLVHGYLGVDKAIVRDVVEHRLGDLLGFQLAIRKRLGEGD